MTSYRGGFGLSVASLGAWDVMGSGFCALSGYLGVVAPSLAYVWMWFQCHLVVGKSWMKEFIECFDSLYSLDNPPCVGAQLELGRFQAAFRDQTSGMAQRQRAVRPTEYGNRVFSVLMNLV